MCTITDKINKIEGADVRFTYDLLMWLPGNFTTNSQTITSTSESGRQVVLTTKYKLSSTYKKLIQATWHAWVTINNSSVCLGNTMMVLPEAGFPDGKVDLENNNAELVISISTGTSTYMIATGVAMVVLAGISIVLVKKTKEE